MEQTARPPLWTREFMELFLSNFFLFVSFQMLTPTLPAYVQQAGGSDFTVGLSIAMFTVTALFIRPFAGKALDSLERKQVLLVGLGIFILSVMGYYWFCSVAVILLLRAIHGIGWGITTTTYGTLVSDIIPAERRGEGMGYYGLSSNLAMAMAPFVGLWVMADYGFGWLFSISAGMAVFALIIAQFLVYSKPMTAPPQTGGILKRLLEEKALFPSLLVLLLGMTYGGVVTFITLFGREVQIENVGWFFVSFSLMVMLVRPVGGKVFDRKGHPWVLVPGAVFCLSGILLLSVATGNGSLVAAAVCYGAGFGAVQPALMAWTIQRVPVYRRGAANGTFFSAFDLGIGIGAMLLGAVAEVVGYAAMYRISSVALLLFMVIYGVYLLKNKSQQINEGSTDS